MQARANMGAAALAPVLSETMARLRSIHEARIKTSVHSIGERLRLREARAEGELTGGGTNPMRRGFWGAVAAATFFAAGGGARAR